MTYSSSIKAVKYYSYSVVIMDEGPLTKQTEVFIAVDNFIAVAILMVVLEMKTILATTVKKKFYQITDLLLR